MDRFAIVPDTAILAIGKVSNLAGVYMFYAMHADRDGANARPSVVSAAKFFSIQRRSVERCLAWLVQHGLMVEDGTAGNRITRYRMVRNMPPPGDIFEDPNMPPSSDMPLQGDMPHESGIKMPLQSAPRCRSQAAQPYPLTRPLPDHTPEGSVNRAALAGEDEEARSARQDQEAAPPPAVERGIHTDLEEREEQDGQARRLIDEGLFTDRGGLSARYQACLALVQAYRRRWPRSWPSDWTMAADFPQLTGSVKDRPAWIATHLSGYSNGWMPENQDGSVRVWHSLLLAGDLDAAMKAAKVENGYSPERASAAMKAREQEPPSSDLRELMENISAIQDAPEATGKRHKPSNSSISTLLDFRPRC